MAGFILPAFCRPGSVRLSHVLARSTMGAGGFNGRVRNGIGWNSPAMTTRPAKCRANWLNISIRIAFAWAHYQAWDSCLSVQACRAIRTGKLNALLRLHTQPINVVVFHGSRRDLVLRQVSRLDAFSGYLFRT